MRRIKEKDKLVNMLKNQFKIQSKVIFPPCKKDNNEIGKK